MLIYGDLSPKHLHSFNVYIEAVHMGQSSTGASGFQVMISAKYQDGSGRSGVQRRSESLQTLHSHLPYPPMQLGGYLINSALPSTSGPQGTTYY